MNKITKTLAVLFLLSPLYACSGAGQPASGSAIVVLADEATNATKESAAKNYKTGKACMLNILSLVTTGDASIEAAARNGGIKTITSIDKEIKAINFYIALGQSCTVVRGY